MPTSTASRLAYKNHKLPAVVYCLPAKMVLPSFFCNTPFFRGIEMSIRFSRFLGRAVSLFAAALVLVSAASTLISEQVIFNFTGKSGMTPNSRLIQDSSGRFYGTTIYGGQPGPNCLSIYGCGVVFELAPKSGGGWNYRRLHAFTGG